MNRPRHHWRQQVADLAARWRFKRHADEPLDIARVRAHLGRPQWVRRAITPPLERRVVHVGARAVDLLVPPRIVPGRVVLYVHGGGFIACSPDTHRPLAGRLAHRLGALVVLPDYRLAPEHPHPAAREDVLRTWRRLLAAGVAPAQVAFAGDSAGGGLVLGALQTLRDAGEPLPAAAVAFSPWADLAATGPSVTENAERCALFRPAQLAAAAACYAGARDVREADLSPVYGAFDRLPPLCLHASDDELLRDDAGRVAERTRAVGGVVEYRTWPGVPHGWQFLDPWLPEARASLDAASAFVRAHVVDAPVPDLAAIAARMADVAGDVAPAA